MQAFPGIFDLHTHGLLGYHAFGPGLAEVIRRLPRYGVTSFLATTVTLPLAQVKRKLAEMAQVLADPPTGARCLGIHLEGPHISPNRTGLANPAWTLPLTRSGFDELQEAASGYIKMITFAPEQGEALHLIPYLLEQGVIPSIGHSDANYEQVAEARELGLRHATHTFNAMKPFHHRAPGVIGAVMAYPEITAELIADGHHVHAGAMRALFNAKGAQGICLVSDSAPFAGLPPGEYMWEGYSITVDGNTCRTPEGHLAGSYALLDASLRNLVELVGLTPNEAVTCASVVPAREMGMEDRKGRLLAGYDADLVIVDRFFNVHMVIGEGRILYPDMPG
jgi:N-acetylglucosamine-6-phosphate deacetylase